ncbi:hypothetical protein Rvan_1418 [Rhodomicrobium vannielii ATCC 17100]|uniref:Uncharacterized protein n=1 Tax=Rhodomicrobium vannielii (strain ATCC 17100 / DSM 162 / LMG 4299 / NCIMB 10020 / ATH 3.1.1) TaxID=648757 RepID=E3I6M8_RHOVT|nr:hypothetical protein Rvan_1418 [Rhodomicrobium vannielii ATCC 17100]
MCAALVLASGAAHADSWGQIPFISATLGDMPNRLCMGAPDPAHQHDIGCPSYSPYLTSGGLLGVGTSSPTATLQVSGSFIVSTSAQTTNPSLYVGTNGNVGIGTTALAEKLRIEGNIKMPANSYIDYGSNWADGTFSIRNSGTDILTVGSTSQFTSHLPIRTNDGDIFLPGYGFRDQQGVGMRRISSNKLGLLTNYVDWLVINSTGNVGIGTATPTTALEVSGTISATNLVINGVPITGGATSSDRITSNTDNVTVNGTTHTISFTTNGSVANYLDSSGRLVTTGISVTTNQLSATTGYFSGNVGIGVAPTASGTLHVKGTIYRSNGAYESTIDSSGLSISSPNGTSSNIRFTQVGISDWTITNKAGTGSLAFQLSGVPLMEILPSGKIGLGTITPTTALEVSGTISATHFVGDGSGLTGLAASGDRITSGTTAVTVNGATSTISFTTNNVVTGYVDSSGRLITPGISVTTNQLSATTGYFSGYVNIGNATSGKLGWNGSLNNSISFSPGYTKIAGNPYIQLGSDSVWSLLAYPTNTSLNAGVLIRAPVDDKPALVVFPKNPTHTADLQQWQDSSGNVLAEVTNSGSLGIGTTTPTATLQVSGSFIVSTSGQTTNPSLYVGTDGNVGIGTAIPSTTLSVSGTGSFGSIISSYGLLGSLNNSTGLLLSLGGNSGGSSSIVSVLGSASNRQPASAITFVGTGNVGGWQGGEIRFQTIPAGDSNNLRDRLTIKSDGTIGIGTTAPNANLEVSGTISATHFVGDGSGLTNLSVQGDRITSGTTAVTVNSATSTISFTTNGSVANYVDSSGRLVTTGISVTTNQLSATTAYFSGDVGIGSAFVVQQSPNNTGTDNFYAGHQAGVLNTSGYHNAGVSERALSANTTGNENTAFGYIALGLNTTGYWNTGLGAGANYTNVSGSENTAVGADALNKNLANNNTAVGSQALAANTTGTLNDAFGRNALKANTTGSNNAAFGGGALGSNVDGSGNIAIGSAALNGNIHGNTNVGIGIYSLLTSTGNDNIAIGNSAGSNLTTGNANILLGFNVNAPSNTTSNWLNIGNIISGSIATTGVIGFGGSVTVAGTVSATRFVGDGSGLTGIATGSTDRITSGTASVIANQNTGVSVSAPMDVSGNVAVSGTVSGNAMQLTGAGTPTCDAAHKGLVYYNDAAGTIEVCRP